MYEVFIIHSFVLRQHWTEQQQTWRAASQWEDMKLSGSVLRSRMLGHIVVLCSIFLKNLQTGFHNGYINFFSLGASSYAMVILFRKLLPAHSLKECSLLSSRLMVLHLPSAATLLKGCGDPQP